MKFDLLKLEEPVRSEVLAVAAWRHFDRGVVLFHEGEAGGSLHVLMRGRVAVRVTTPDGDTATLNVIGPGEAFGELSLLNEATMRTATVQAIEPAQTLVLQRAEFERLRRSYPSVDRLLVEYLAGQVRRLSERLAEALCLESVHRLGGWTALGILAVIVPLEAARSLPPGSNPVGLLRQPSVLLLATLVLLVAHPWLGAYRRVLMVATGAGIEPVLPYLLGSSPVQFECLWIARCHRAAIGTDLVQRVLDLT